MVDTSRYANALKTIVGETGASPPDRHRERPGTPNPPDMPQPERPIDVDRKQKLDQITTIYYCQRMDVITPERLAEMQSLLSGQFIDLVKSLASQPGTRDGLVGAIEAATRTSERLRGDQKDAEALVAIVGDIAAEATGLHDRVIPGLGIAVQVAGLAVASTALGFLIAHNWKK